MKVQNGKRSAAPAIQFTPSLAKIAGGLFPGGKRKAKIMLGKNSRNDPSAFQQKLRFSPDKPGAYFQQPLRSWKPNLDSPRFPKRAHEFLIGHGVWRCQIHSAINGIVLDQ